MRYHPLHSSSHPHGASGALGITCGGQGPNCKQLTKKNLVVLVVIFLPYQQCPTRIAMFVTLVRSKIPCQLQAGLQLSRPHLTFLQASPSFTRNVLIQWQSGMKLTKDFMLVRINHLIKVAMFILDIS